MLICYLGFVIWCIFEIWILSLRFVPTFSQTKYIIVRTYKVSILLVIFQLCFFLPAVFAQPLNNKKQFTHQDTLRGTITPERAWWDVLQYNISVKPDYSQKTIEGETEIKFRALKQGRILQIDL